MPTKEYIREAIRIVVNLTPRQSKTRAEVEGCKIAIKSAESIIARCQADILAIQKECDHVAPRIKKSPSPNDKSGSGGFPIYYCAVCGRLMHEES